MNKLNKGLVLAVAFLFVLGVAAPMVMAEPATPATPVVSAADKDADKDAKENKGLKTGQHKKGKSVKTKKHHKKNAENETKTDDKKPAA